MMHQWEVDLERQRDADREKAKNQRTLRDWFAGQALTAVVTRTDASTPGNIAAAAYTLADAMLKEREQ
jgi:pyruvoyl-dependent arginine decarboxylase (PvlArgDC)